MHTHFLEEVKIKDLTVRPIWRSAFFLALFLGFSTALVNAKKVDASMNSKPDCGKTTLSKSECMIGFVLEDIKSNYKHVGGGGITEIKSIATNVYRASISQEERIDHITYEFDLKSNGELHISKRTESSETVGLK